MEGLGTYPPRISGGKGRREEPLYSKHITRHKEPNSSDSWEKVNLRAECDKHQGGSCLLRVSRRVSEKSQAL